MKYFRLSILAISLLFSSWISGQTRGDLVSDSLAMTLSKSTILDIYAGFSITELLFPIQFDSLEIHRIEYITLNGRGDGLILASGLVTFPVGTQCVFPLLDYNHGSLLYDQGISDFNAPYNQSYIGVPFAASGYVTALPDYLGYGATPLDHPHPYVHAKSEATAVVDMLRATKKLCASKQVQLNEKLFLLGYSQGGHVTMAVQRELEVLHTDEFTVTASAPCSGPYDLSGIMFDSIFYSQTYSNPFFISFTSLSQQYIYQNLYSDLSEMFQAPYDSMILRMTDRSNPQSNFRDSLPTIGYMMFQTDYLAEILADSAHAIRQNLRDNDLYNWRPNAPVRLYYCTQDEQVPYINSLAAADSMTALGADVTAFNVGPLNHILCTPFALVSAKLWFDMLRTNCASETKDLAENNGIQISPNPFQTMVTVLIPKNETGVVRLTDLLGRRIQENTVTGTQQVTVPADLPPGAYLASIQVNGLTTVIRLIKM